MLNMGGDVGMSEEAGRQWGDGRRPDVLLLTGVTGFLGKRLLTELLAHTQATIVCLVRAANELEAQRRGRALSRDLRVVFIAADLEEERLGLSARAWDMLALRVSEIYHCAASVSFDLPLAASRRINVQGTRTLLKLAVAANTHHQFRRFHHVSTAYVAGKKRGRVSADYLPDVHDSRQFRNPYEQSKAEAELMLRSQSEIPITIYRPSIVAGDTRHGVTDNFNVLYAPMRLIHRGALPFMPAGRVSELDCVGVDYVVRGIVALGKNSQGPCDSYHLTAGEASFRVQDMVRISNEESAVVRGVRLQEAEASGRKPRGAHSNSCEVISRLHWSSLRIGAAVAQLLPKTFLHSRRWGKRVSRGIRSFAVYEPYTQVNTTFECEEEIALLAASGIAQPPPLDYLRTIVRYAISVEFTVDAVESGVSLVMDIAEHERSQIKPIAAGQTI